MDRFTTRISGFTLRFTASSTWVAEKDGTVMGEAHDKAEALSLAKASTEALRKSLFLS